MKTEKNDHDTKSGDVEEIKPFTIEKPKRRKTFRNGVLQHFRDYCSSTSIHGFSYFGERRTWIEYVWWCAAFSVSIFGVSYMIREIYTKWSQSPVIVSFATKKLPIYEIPFPAVTICPLIKMEKDFFNLTQYIETDPENRTEEMDKLANYMELLCDSKYSEINKSRFIEDPDDFYEITRKYKPRFIPSSSVVTYQGKEYTFEDVFKETYTEQGLCYTFNRMNLREIYSDAVVINEKYEDVQPSTWHPDSGYDRSVKGSKSYPRRAMSSGMNNGLEVIILDEKSNNDFNCIPLVQGYTITLHYPARIPDTGNDFIMLSADDFIAVPINPSVVLTSETVRNYHPDQRDCYFPSERQLKYFKVYTMNNCKMECLRNATLKMCDCVEYYMPRENGTKVCGSGSQDCLEATVIKMKDALIRQREDGRYGLSENKDGYNEDDDGEYVCDCLPMCNDVTYRAYVEPMNIKKEQMMAYKNHLTEEMPLLDIDRFQISIVLLYMKNDRVSTTERNELYGPTDFISNFGGLLGLFTGFSILSFLEIIYFLTLRIFGNIRLFGYWAGPSE